MKKGFFITFEGGDASGKTTQITFLKEYIKNNNLEDKFLFVKEPGGAPLTNEIRRLIQNYEIDPPLPKTELLLFTAARVENVEKAVKPALEAGKIVVADRFYDSTVAYQGMARGVMSGEEILSLTKTFIGDLTPDLTFYLKLDPSLAVQRKSSMGELDRFEKESLEFFEKVKEGYDFMAKKESQRFCVIDASKSASEVFNDILNVLKSKNII